MKEDSKNELMVTIHCLAYNHEPYIRQCLDGFVMQKTNFRFEAIVHDDASTDGTAAIIREYAEKYPKIIKPIFEKENLYSKHNGSISRIMNEHTRGKYIAICEGDDYWIDPLKLQKQVDFLEANPDYGLIHSNFVVLYQQTKKIKHNGSSKYIITNGYIFEELFRGCWIKTLTVLYRRNLMQHLPQLPSNCFDGDIFLFFEIAKKAKVYYDNSETGVYRVLEESASHFIDEEKKYTFQSRLKNLDYYYANNMNISETTRFKLNKKWFLIDCKHYLKTADYVSFIRLKNLGYLSYKDDGFLYLCYRLCQNIYFFHAFGICIKLKLKLYKCLKMVSIQIRAKN